MEFNMLISIVWGRRWIVLTILALVLLIVAAGNTFIASTYSSSATLRVATASAGSADFVSYDTQYADRLMSTYVKLVSTEGVLAELAKRLGVVTPPKVKAEIQANTELIVLTVEAVTPTLARDGADALAQILIEQSKNAVSADEKVMQTQLDQRLQTAIDELTAARQKYEDALVASNDQTFPVPGGSTRVSPAREITKQDVDLKEKVYLSALDQVQRSRLSATMRVNSIALVNPAPLPINPISPNRLINLAAGLVAGLLAGVGLAVLIDKADTTLYTSKQIQQVTQLPILSQVPLLVVPQRRNKQPLQLAQPLQLFKYGSPQLEAIRRLYLSLNISATHPNNACTILVTSAEPGEGKSTLVANLATVIAQSGRRVVVVDGDLRHPVLHMAFGLFKASGLSDLLLSGCNETDLAHSVSNTRIPNLFMLNAGSPITHLGDLVASPRMAKVIQSLKQSYDVVLIDSPPLLAVSDALALTGLSDTTLLVVERGRAKSDIVRTACQMLHDVNAPSIGLVVNRAEQGIDYGYLGNNVRALNEPNIASNLWGAPLNNQNGKAQSYAEYMQYLKSHANE